MDLYQLTLFALVFLLVATLSFGIMYGVAVRRRRIEERLRMSSTGSDPNLGSSPDLVLGEATPALAAQLPMTEEARTGLQKDLNAAGFYRKSALIEYAALRTVLTLTPLIAAGLVALLVEREMIWTVVIIGVIAAMLGFSLPRVYLWYAARVRAREIERGLPVAVDMLTMSLAAGQNILASVQRVSLDLRFSYPVVAEEFLIVYQQSQLRNLPYALNALADRVQVPEVRNLAMILAQSEKLGTDVSAVLLEYSNNFRTTLRQRADAQANRMNFWLLIPVVFCLWVPCVIVLIGPPILEFRENRRQARESMPSVSEQLRLLDELKERQPRPPSNQPPGNQPPAGNQNQPMPEP